MELPCLAFYHSERSTTLFSASQQKRILADDTDELLRNKTLYPAARGLLLIRDPASQATFLWSPQDGEQIHLPPLDGIEDDMLMHSQCHLSDEPYAPGCVVIVVEGGDDTFIWYCRPGDDQWVKYDYDIGTQPALPDPEGNEFEKTPICAITACRGKFYFYDSTTKLGVLEFCPDPVFSSIPIDDSHESEDDEEEYCEDDEEEYCEDDEEEREDGEELEDTYEPHPSASAFHVESGGELYMVTLFYVSPRSDEVAECFVEKMDFSARRWRAVDDLGGRTFLLSRYYFGASCFCGETGGLQQDRVYVVNPWKKEMLVFDVIEATHSLHQLDEAPSADKAFWLLPKEN